MAVQLGYKNVWRDPLGLPAWADSGRLVERTPVDQRPVSGPPAAGGPLHGWGLLWTLAAIFLGGMALNLTPCVYPLIPITVSYFGGRDDRRGIVGLGLCYLAGLAVTNSALGMAASLGGGLMGGLLQHPAVLIGMAGIMTGLALSLFGVWEIRLPGFLTRAASKSYGGYLGGFFMGLTLGVVAAPCLGPFILGLLTWVAGIGSLWIGFLVFFTLSLGLGTPLFFLALFSGQVHKLPRSGEWMLWVRRLLGWVMIGMAAYFTRSLWPKGYDVWPLALTALAAGVHLGWIDRTRASFKGFSLAKDAVGVAAVLLAVFWISGWWLKGPSVDWKPWTETRLAEAAAQNKPVVIDFYAAWCAPCRELEEVTFHDPKVVEKAGRDWVMIQVDLTQSGDEAKENLVKRYGIKGVPTLVVIDGQGRERHDLRQTDYLTPDRLLALMAPLTP